jgi:hypothetical protein
VPEAVRHPDFEPGNQAHLTHGATSPRVIEARAADVHERLLEVAPWLAEERYAPTVARYIRATAREMLAHEHLMAASKLSSRLLEAATASSRLAWQMGDALGLTPAGHARLKMLVAGGEHAEASLSDLIAEGRRIRQRAEERQRVAALRAAGALKGDEGTEDPNG